MTYAARAGVDAGTFVRLCDDIAKDAAGSEASTQTVNSEITKLSPAHLNPSEIPHMKNDTEK